MACAARPTSRTSRGLAGPERAAAVVPARLYRPDRPQPVDRRPGVLGDPVRGELKGLDPPPTWPLGEALLDSRDTAFRLRIIKVLVALAAVDKVRVVCVLCEPFKERRDVEVKRAVATALLVLVTERLGQGPSPAEDLARDLDLES
jgi:hypothetical protein